MRMSSLPRCSNTSAAPLSGRQVADEALRLCRANTAGEMPCYSCWEVTVQWTDS